MRIESLWNSIIDFYLYCLEISRKIDDLEEAIAIKDETIEELRNKEADRIFISDSNNALNSSMIRRQLAASPRKIINMRKLSFETGSTAGAAGSSAAAGAGASNSNLMSATTHLVGGSTRNLTHSHSQLHRLESNCLLYTSDAADE